MTPSAPTFLGFTPDRAAMVLFAGASAGALGTALVAQFGFGLWPCALCHVQRAPYLATLVLGLLALMPAVDRPSRRRAAELAAALFLIATVAAGYHVGVEERWWPGPTECTGRITEYAPVDLLAAVSQPGRTGCEEAAIRILGISMAGYNVLLAASLTVASMIAIRRKAWWQ